MFKKFYPSIYYKSVYDIDFQEYYDKGFRGIIFDIDNTLVPHNADADEKAEALFERLRSIGFDTCLTSNNKEARVVRFNKNIQSHYVYKANKPLKSGYRKAMKKMRTNVDNTMFVGDQLFTDVYGANRLGLYSVLLAPINPKEEIQIVIKRYFEKMVLFIGRDKIDKRF